MLRITLGDYVADLLNNELSIVLTSPYPLVSTTAGNFIYNFTLPATDGLKKVFKYAHRPASVNNIVKVPFRIDAGSGLIFEGIADVSEASAFEYEIFCPVQNGDFNYQAKKIKLAEIDLGGDRLLDENPDRAIAELVNDIDLDITQDLSFDYEIPVTFTSIQINPESELNEAGNKFTSAENVNLTITADININANWSNLIEFRLLKNGVIYETKALSGSGNESILFELDVLEGDELTWNIYVEAANTGYEFRIYLSILAGTLLSIRRTYCLSMFNAAQNRYPDVDYAVFPIENPEVFSSWDEDFYQIDNLSVKTLYNQYFKVINYWKNGFPSYMTGLAEIEENNFQFLTAGNIFIPFPYLAYLIKQIALAFGFSISNNPFDNELKYTVLVNHFLENEFLEDNTRLIKPKEGFNLQDHVPDWTIYDFLKHICNLFGIGYEIDNQLKILTFNFLDDILNNESAEDISHLLTEPVRINNERMITGVKLIQKVPTSDKYFENVKSLEGLNYKGVVDSYFNLPAGILNDCYFVTILNGYYAYKYNPDTYKFEWVRHSNNFKEFIATGTEYNDLSSELCPVQMRSPNLLDDVLGAPENRNWLIPASHQPGKFEGAPEMYQTKWAAGILFYHGLLPDYSSNNYPFASNDVFDPHGNKIESANLSLKIDGEYGLYEKKWKQYIEWRITARDVIAKIQPDNKFLRNFRFSKKYMIDGVKYIIADYKGSINSEGPGIAELTVMPV